MTYRPAPELLAPAGTLELAQAALRHGADAVYAGVGHFNLRSRSANLTLDELPELLTLAASHKAKAYLVLNTMPDDTMLEGIEELLCTIASRGALPHAFIVSDPGVLALCSKHLAEVERHLSTQTGTFNHGALSFWKSLGVSRVILPRELTMAQITALSARGLCELELFVHGAMCVSIAGRCLLGAWMSGRHGNHGDCPQPCRLRYDIRPHTEDAQLSQWLSVEEDAQGSYLLNAKDLNSLPILPQIIDSGIASLKIEGRNKSVHYVSSVVKVYRAAVDAYCANPQGYTLMPQWLEELELLDHRPYTTGFYGGEHELQAVHSGKSPSRIRVVGMVKAMLSEHRPLVDVKNPFDAGETLELLPVSASAQPHPITIETITDIEGNPLSRALTNRLVTLKTTPPLRVGDLLRRREGCGE
jgi:putative protease